LKIALDYDATYTLDPPFWDEVILLIKHFGHEVFLLTYRDERYDWTDEMTHLEEVMEIPVYCTRGVAKKWWAEHFGPGKVDVWFDDNPASVFQNSSFAPDALAEWRKTDPGGERPAQ
jgi:hypothetical protein